MEKRKKLAYNNKEKSGLVHKFTLFQKAQVLSKIKIQAFQLFLFFPKICFRLNYSKIGCFTPHNFSKCLKMKSKAK